jgi:hypothetical protein
MEILDFKIIEFQLGKHTARLSYLLIFTDVQATVNLCMQNNDLNGTMGFPNI